jgi:tripartite-type tricarboxylate transporter receptor subunit TctC
MPPRGPPPGSDPAGNTALEEFLMTNTRRSFGLLACGIACGLTPALAAVQREDATLNFPTRPIRLIVPWVAGGGTDIVTRFVSVKLAENLGQQIVVDNRPGANGIIGADLAAKAAPDGYTIVLHSIEHVINASVYAKLPYDTLGDITALSLVGKHALVLIVSPSSPAKSVSQLVALARAKPGEITFGSWGTSSLSHLSGEMLRANSKVAMTHVPYKGAPQSAVDVMSGRISYMFTTSPTSLPSIRAGKAVAIAATSAKRLAFLPEVPTMIESGYPGFEVESWRALFAPAKTPKPIVQRLHEQIVRAVHADDVRQNLTTAGFDATTSTPAELDGFARSELAKWGKVAKEAGVRID